MRKKDLFLVFLSGLAVLLSTHSFGEGFSGKFYYETGQDYPLFSSLQTADGREIKALEEAEKEGYLKVYHSGLSAEQPYTGEKSYKLDISFSGQGCYFTQNLTEPISTRDACYLSGELWLKDSQGYTVGLSGTVRFKKPDGGYHSEVIVLKNKGKAYADNAWNYLSFNLSEDIRESCLTNTWNPEESFLSAITVRILSQAALIKDKKRVTLYLDDLRISSRKERKTKDEGKIDGDYLYKLTMDYETPHTKWAKPLAGGPIKALFIAPFGIPAREIVELAQRLDLKFEAVLFRGSDLLTPMEQGTWEGLALKGSTTDEKTDELERKLEKDYDVIIFGNIQPKIIPCKLLYRIIEKVAGGTGLIFCYNNTGDLDVKLEKTTDKLDAIGNGILFPVNFVHAYYLKKGRVAVLDYPNKTNCRWDGNCLTPGDTWNDKSATAYDYRMSLLAKTIRWSCRKEPVTGFGDFSRALAGQTNTPREKLPAELKIDLYSQDEQAGKFKYRIRDEYGTEEKNSTTQLQIKKGENSAKIEVPALRRGKHYIDCWIITGEDVRDWGSFVLNIESLPRIADIKLNKPGFLPEETLEGKIELADISGDNARLELCLLDTYGNIYERIEQNLKPAEKEIPFSFNLSRGITISSSLEIKLWEDGELVDFDKRRIYVKRFFPEKFLSIIWAGWDQSYPHTHLEFLMTKRVAEAGFNCALNAHWFNLEQLQLQAVAGNMTAVIYPLWIRCPGENEDLINWCTNRAEGAGKSTAWHPVVIYSLGDENTLQPRIPLNAYLLNLFKDYLRAKYGQINKLNEIWGANYRDFADIEPVKQFGAVSELAKSHDQLSFIESEYARYHELCSKTIKKYVPDAKVGAEGSESGDLELMTSKLEMWSPYHDYRDDMLLASIAPHVIKGNWWGGYTGQFSDRAYNVDILWRGLGKGVWNSSWFWMATGYAGVIGSDFKYIPYFQDMLSDFRRVHDGAGQFLASCKISMDGVAIHYSQVNEHASQLSAGYGDSKKSAIALQNLLDGLGIGYQYLTRNNIEANCLSEKGYKIIFLPCSQALSDKEVTMLKDFAAKGGTIAADIGAGLFDGYLRPRKDSSIADLFGISRPTDSKPVKEPIILAGEIGGIGFNLETSGLTEKGIEAKAARRLSQGTIFINKIGKGTAILLNFNFASAYAGDKDNKGYYSLMDGLLNLAGVKRRFIIDEPEHICVRSLTMGDLSVLGVTCAPKLIERIMDFNKEEKYASPRIMKLPGKMHVYEMRTEQYLGKIDEITVPATRPTNSVQTHIYVLMRKLPEIKAEIPDKVKQGDNLNVALSLKGAENAEGRVIRIHLKQPDGKEALSFRRYPKLEKDGKKNLALAIPYNAPPGGWEMEVRDVPSGVAVTNKFQIIK